MVVVMFIIVIFVVVLIEVLHVRIVRLATLYLFNPGRARGYLLKVEKMCIEEQIQIDIAIIAFHNTGRRLKRANYLLYLAKL